MKSRFLPLVLLGSLILPFSAVASIPTELNVFYTQYVVEVPDIQVPTRVQVHLENVQSYSVAVMNNSTGQVEPIFQQRETEVEKPTLAVESTTALIGESTALVDGNPDTWAEFDLDKDGGAAEIIHELVP